MLRCSLIAVLLLGTVVGTVASAAETEKEADTCGLCHEQETKEWTDSPHAQAINDHFLGEWTREGQKWECLVCHTSQYDRKTGQFSHAGVSCQSCHGPANEDHPDKVKKLLPVTSATCESCHSITYGEWRISGHGQKNIRCIDCHKMHQMQLRKEDPDQMCGSCHTERLNSFSHATHHLKGVHCIDCHMPPVMGGSKINGTGTRGHTFGVGAETCARCHREMVHSSGELASLEQEVQTLKAAASPEALKKQLAATSEETTKLRASVQANRRVLGPLVFLSFLLGAFFGLALPYFRRQKPEAPGK